MTSDIIKEVVDVIKDAIKILGPTIVGYKVCNLPNCYFIPSQVENF